MSDLYTAHTQIKDGIAGIGGTLNDQEYAHTEMSDNIIGVWETLNNQGVTLNNQELTLNNMFETVGEINMKVDSCTQSDPQEVLNKLNDTIV